MNGTWTTCTTKASMFQSSYSDGFQDSRKEGREEGRQAKKLAIACSLIGLLSVEVIAEKTGLDPETTAQLQPF